MKRAAGYIRVSQVGDRQGDSFLSPEVQREKVEAWAAYREFHIVGWYVDLDAPASKGAKPRPEFDRMMRDAREGKFEAVAVYRLTRFARSLSAAASAYDELERLGVALVSVTEDIDTTTVAGSLMRNILFALAEFESQRIGEEWRNVHAARRRKGIAHVALPMYGFKIAGAEIVGVEEAEAAGVRQMFDLRLRGEGYGAIRSALLDAGFRPKQCGERFSLSTIRDMLKNPLYAGLVRLADGELIEATHDAIVPREQWEAVQVEHERVRELGRHRAGLLSGLLICSGCGYRMKMENHADRRVYRCGARARSNPCPKQATISADKVDEWVERRFLSRFDPKRMPDGGRLRRTRQQQQWQRKAAKLRARVEELTRALDELAAQRYVKGSLAHAEYERQFERFAEERSAVESEADDLERAAKSVPRLDVDALGLWPGLPVAVKRRALRLIIDSIEVRPSEVRGGSHSRGIDFRQRLTVNWTR